MKNYDLIWARDWAGLTQADAAEKMGVHRVTFAKWETGAQAIPARKWQLFLKRVAINPQDIPNRVAYDAKGYPVGFDRAVYEEMAIDIASFTAPDGDESYDDVFGWDLQEVALMEIEGDDYDARSRERTRISYASLGVKSFRDSLPEGSTIDEKAAQARLDWEPWELSTGKDVLQKAASEWRRWKSSGSKDALANAKAEWRRWRLPIMEASLAYAAEADLA